MGNSHSGGNFRFSIFNITPKTFHSWKRKHACNQYNVRMCPIIFIKHMSLREDNHPRQRRGHAKSRLIKNLTRVTLAYWSVSLKGKDSRGVADGRVWGLVAFWWLCILDEFERHSGAVIGSRLAPDGIDSVEQNADRMTTADGVPVFLKVAEGKNAKICNRNMDQLHRFLTM